MTARFAPWLGVASIEGVDTSGGLVPVSLPGGGAIAFPYPDTSTTTAVSVSNAGVTTLLAANPNRQGFKIVNPVGSGRRLYVLVGAGVVTNALFTDFLDPGDSWEPMFPATTDVVTATSDGAAANFMVTEYTATILPGNPATGTTSAVAVTNAVGGVVLLAANVNRRGFKIVNPPTNTGTLYIRVGGNPSATLFTEFLLPGDSWEPMFPAALSEVKGILSVAGPENIMASEDT